ncbi:hypothetical protein A9K75_07845 [Campylobacter fetus subsp. testudinum]|uniref:DUF5334 family protein n=1 Tax=Campylobacter fetus TaxID=196 RepID=UPI000818C1AE|nr:DUF5334 family protein [Campylobacter fetus]OCR99229.1 hypothetical protein A9K75_07845 [Campylobacter fetus subsp. testudinum]
MNRIIFFIIFISINIYAWGGYDYNSGSYIEIEKGNLVRSGRDIEIYDYENKSYRQVEVQSVRSLGGGKTEVEIYDHDSGEYRILEMQR